MHLLHAGIIFRLIHEILTALLLLLLVIPFTFHVLMVVSRNLVLLFIALTVLLIRFLHVGPVVCSICCLLMSVVLSSSWGLAIVVPILFIYNRCTRWRTRRLSSRECLLSGTLGSLRHRSNTADSCRFGPRLLRKLSLLVHPQVFHVLVETVG